MTTFEALQAIATLLAWTAFAWLVIRALKRARRDYFAAKAMQSMLDLDARAVEGARPGETVGELVGRKAYAFADAMLKARQQ